MSSIRGTPRRWPVTSVAAGALDRLYTNALPCSSFQMMHAYLGQIAPSSYITKLYSICRCRPVAPGVAGGLSYAPAANCPPQRRLCHRRAPDLGDAPRLAAHAPRAGDCAGCLRLGRMSGRRQPGSVPRRSARFYCGSWRLWRTQTMIGWPGCSCRIYRSTSSGTRAGALRWLAMPSRSGQENASVLRRWVQRWTPKAEDAAAGLAHLLGRAAGGRPGRGDDDSRSEGGT